MRLSVNELETLLRKAAVGAGIDHGHAYETSQSVLRLAGAGIDVIPDLVRALREWADGQSSPVNCVLAGDTCRLTAASDRRVCALYVAPALRDFAQLILKTRRFQRIEVPDVIYPRLVIGQLAVEPWTSSLTVARYEPAGPTRRWNKRQTGDTTPAAALEAAGSTKDMGAVDLLVTDSSKTNDEAMASRHPGHALAVDIEALHAEGVHIDPAHYEALRGYFKLTLVPDSEASRRHGAGAGLVDSD